MKPSVARRKLVSGYALLMVMLLTVLSLVILAGTVGRTYSVARLNDRHNEYLLLQNVAEAAAEKAFARMAYDFTSPGQGLAAVRGNLELYRTDIPGAGAGESDYWDDFVFSDGATDNRIYLAYKENYSGFLPSRLGFDPYGDPYATTNAPVYRIVVNARLKNSRNGVVGTVQQDVLLALLPITGDTIFTGGKRRLEFTWCAPFELNGRVHCNWDIYTGCPSSSYLTFRGPVTAVGAISSPSWAGHDKREYRGKVTYNGGKSTNVPPVMLSLNMTNTHSLIEMPPPTELPDSHQGAQRLYNQAQVLLLVSNNNVTAVVQSGTLPGEDTDKRIIVVTNTPGALKTNFPFLTLNNTFKDMRENKTILVSQIDLGQYNTWLSTNAAVLAKFPAGSGNYPTILFVADNRTTTSSQLTAVRITNGIAPPKNGGLGFSLATPNPLYVWGNFNQTNSSLLHTTNTSSGTVPAGLLCDAITVLSANWKDSESAYDVDDRRKDPAINTTVNAAILAGMVDSTGPNTGQFSGGIMNLTRLLEDWGNGDSTKLTLNTSLINLFASTRATAQFKDPGYYYYAPRRQFSYDLNFRDPYSQPPGFPYILKPCRLAYATPPPNTVTYEVTP